MICNRSNNYLLERYRLIASIIVIDKTIETLDKAI